MNPLRNTITLAVLLSLSLIACEEKVTKKVTNNHYTTEGPATGGGIAETDSSGGGGGVINGGGGKGVLCKDKRGKKTLELLDLYEGRTLFERKIKPLPNEREQAIEAFSILMAKHIQTPGHHDIKPLAEGLRKVFIDPFFERFRFLGSDQKLTVTNDSFEPVLEKGCELVQIGVYYDESVLLIDQSLWDMLDWTNKMAFFAHEIYYKRARDKGATDSMGTRKLVGKMFSEKGVTGLGAGLPRDDREVVECDIKKDGVLFGDLDIIETTTPHSDHAIEVVFQNLNEQNVLFRTSTVLADTSFVHLASGLEIIRTGGLIVDSYHQTGRTGIKMTFSNRGYYEGLSGSITTYSRSTNGVEDELQFACGPSNIIYGLNTRHSKPTFYMEKGELEEPDIIKLYDNGIFEYTSSSAVGNAYSDLPDDLVCEKTVIGFVLDRDENRLTFQELDISDFLYYVNPENYIGSQQQFDCQEYRARAAQEASNGFVKRDLYLNRFQKVDKTELPDIEAYVHWEPVPKNFGGR